MTNTGNRYGALAITFHWVMAILIIALLILGIYMTRIPISMLKLKLYGWHKELGILVLMLACARIGWRLASIIPALPAEIPAWQKFAARAAHWAFYGFMFAMPISGWLLTSAAGLAPSFFGLFLLPNLIGPNENLRVLFTVIHEWLGYGLIALLCLHIAAALKHHFINKDNVLRGIL